MSIIYKSFFKKKSTKIYLWIFILLGITFSSLFIARKYLIRKGNEAYQNSYIYFSSKNEVSLLNEKNIKRYNKAFEVDCNNPLTSIFITNELPIIENEYSNNQCHVDAYTIEYTVQNRINVIENDQLFKSLSKNPKEYFYFINLKNWFKKDKTIKKLIDKYHLEIGVEEYKIDSVNYKNIIFTFEIFIIIVEILFLILFLISIFNILVDEKKNNYLYHYLGYSKIKIFKITINKMFFIIFFPLLIVFLAYIILLII